MRKKYWIREERGTHDVWHGPYEVMPKRKLKSLLDKAHILRVIRENCINCVVGVISIIEDCWGERTCVLYPYRFGIDPSPARKGNPDGLKKAREVVLQGRKKSSGRAEKD